MSKFFTGARRRRERRRANVCEYQLSMWKKERNKATIVESWQICQQIAKQGDKGK